MTWGHFWFLSKPLRLHFFKLVFILLFLLNIQILYFLNYFLTISNFTFFFSFFLAGPHWITPLVMWAPWLNNIIIIIIIQFLLVILSLNPQPWIRCPQWISLFLKSQEITQMDTKWQEWQTWKKNRETFVKCRIKSKCRNLRFHGQYWTVMSKFPHRMKGNSHWKFQPLRVNHLFKG